MIEFLREWHESLDLLVQERRMRNATKGSLVAAVSRFLQFGGGPQDDRVWPQLLDDPRPLLASFVSREATAKGDRAAANTACYIRRFLRFLDSTGVTNYDVKIRREIMRRDGGGERDPEYQLPLLRTWARSRGRPDTDRIRGFLNELSALVAALHGSPADPSLEAQSYKLALLLRDRLAARCPASHTEWLLYRTSQVARLYLLPCREAASNESLKGDFDLMKDLCRWMHSNRLSNFHPISLSITEIREHGRGGSERGPTETAPAPGTRPFPSSRTRSRSGGSRRRGP